MVQTWFSGLLCLGLAFLPLGKGEQLGEQSWDVRSLFGADEMTAKPQRWWE